MFLKTTTEATSTYEKVRRNSNCAETVPTFHIRINVTMNLRTRRELYAVCISKIKHI